MHVARTWRSMVLGARCALLRSSHQHVFAELSDAAEAAAITSARMLQASQEYALITLHCAMSSLLSIPGVQPGARLMLLGSFSAELAALHASKAAEASLRLPGFEYEAARAAQRRRGAGGAGAAAAAAEAAGM